MATGGGPRRRELRGPEAQRIITAVSFFHPVETISLVLKSSDNPPVLSPTVKSVADLQGKWWVAYTKPRCEKALAWDLVRRGIGYFLPMRERVFFSGGRKRRGMLPLFPSYVFLCGDEKDRYTAMTTNRIAQTLDIADQDSFVSELTALERALAYKPDLEPHPSAPVGQRCRIIVGPLEGLEGVVVEHEETVRFILQLDFLNQGAAMEIDADLLEPID